jgi:hypothetical protein
MGHPPVKSRARPALLNTSSHAALGARTRPQSAPLPPPLLKEHEVARLLDITMGALRRMRWLSTSGRRQVGPPHLKIGRCVRYELEAVMAYIAACRVQLEEPAKR